MGATVNECDALTSVFLGDWLEAGRRSALEPGLGFSAWARCSGPHVQCGRRCQRFCVLQIGLEGMTAVSCCNEHESDVLSRRSRILTFAAGVGFRPSSRLNGSKVLHLQAKSVADGRDRAEKRHVALLKEQLQRLPSSRARKRCSPRKDVSQLRALHRNVFQGFRCALPEPVAQSFVGHIDSATPMAEVATFGAVLRVLSSVGCRLRPEWILPRSMRLALCSGSVLRVWRLAWSTWSGRRQVCFAQKHI